MNNKLLTFAILTTISLTSCKSTPPLQVNSEANISENSLVSKVNREALRHTDNIEMPSNYDVNAFYRFNIAAYVEKLGWEADARKTSLDIGIVSKLMENELARTKRFNVFSRSCASCDDEAAYQIENTTSDGVIDIGQETNPDYILETSISLGTVIKELYDHNEIIFRSTVTSKLINPETKEIIHAFAPIRHNSPAKNYFAIDEKYIGGFNLNNQNELQQAYKESAQKAIQVLVTRVMEYYPVGGQVTNYRNGRLAIDAGIEQGFAVKQPVVLFLSDDGLDIPVASADITPKKNSGSGMIITWRDDKDAQDVKAKLDALGKDYLKTNKIFAVSVGTPDTWKL